MGYGYSRSSKGDWRNVILPAPRQSRNSVQTMSYMIRGLEPGQQYEAKVQARNKFGWSPVSKSFVFQTAERGKSTCCSRLTILTKLVNLDVVYPDIRHYYDRNGKLIYYGIEDFVQSVGFFRTKSSG